MNSLATPNSSSAVVEALLEWSVAGRAPDIMLSFDGLNQPTRLWEELTALGWVIPPRPPPPGNAIEWVPDPVAGTDYTLKSWTVQEFRLRHGEWTNADHATISDRTISVMHRHGVQMRGLPASAVPAEAPRSVAAPTQAAAQPATAAATQPVASAGAGPAAAVRAQSIGASTIILDTAERTVEDPTAESFVGISGREKRTCMWTETTSAQFDASSLAELYDRSGHAWTIDGDVPATPANHASIRIIVLDTAADNKKVGKLAKSLGDRSGVVSLKPVSPDHDSTAALVFAAVAANHLEMMLSNVRLRYTHAIVRVDSA